MKFNSRVYVAGSGGMVGSAIVRNLKEKGYTNIITIPSSECDLRDRDAVENLFSIYEPEYVIIAAAKVGGIVANRDNPADFIRDNLLIQTNLIETAYRFSVKKLLFLGSSCIYPKMCPQPIKEEYLMTGELEPTNDAYAIAKIAGLKMCQAYKKQYGFNAISLMPTNLYGPNDNFDLESSHVLPAMIAKYHSAQEGGYYIDMGGPFYARVTLWGDGSPMREFLHVDDLAEACYVAMQEYDGDIALNVGTGEDVTIKELAETISSVVRFEGETVWDTDKPNGTPRKLLNIGRIKELGWTPKISLRQGIASTYAWYKDSLTKS